MAQFYVTVDEDVMREVFQGDDGLTKLVEAVLNQILQAQVTEHLQAAPYQRTDERQGYRNAPRTCSVARVRSQSALIAIGINGDGYREVLGLKIGNSESEDSWSEFFAWLKVRGLHGVDLVVSDDHRGLVNAIQTHFQGASWQRCQTHLIRNILDACPKPLQTE